MIFMSKCFLPKRIYEASTYGSLAQLSITTRAGSLARQSDGLLIRRPGVQLPSGSHFTITFNCSNSSDISKRLNSIRLIYLRLKGETMPKVSVDIPQELLDDLNQHVGDNKKFVTQADAIRTALRKMLDQLDDIDRRHGRLDE